MVVLKISSPPLGSRSPTSSSCSSSSPASSWRSRSSRTCSSSRSASSSRSPSSSSASSTICRAPPTPTNSARWTTCVVSPVARTNTSRCVERVLTPRTCVGRDGRAGQAPRHAAGLPPDLELPPRLDALARCVAKPRGAFRATTQPPAQPTESTPLWSEPYDRLCCGRCTCCKGASTADAQPASADVRIAASRLQVLAIIVVMENPCRSCYCYSSPRSISPPAGVAAQGGRVGLSADNFGVSGDGF